MTSHPHDAQDQPMREPRVLEPSECERLLRSGVVGRVALSTPDGPHIVPVDYTVLDDTVVIRTSAYSVLGTYGRNAMLAFEVDHIDYERHAGWSVVVRGRGWAEAEPTEIARIRETWPARPWAGGHRNLYLRIRWDSLAGRSLGSDGTRHSESAVPHTLSAS